MKKLLGSQTKLGKRKQIGNRIEKQQTFLEKQITELKERERLYKIQLLELRQAHSRTEKKYRTLYENSLALCRKINTNGIIIDCNKSYAERLGYTKEEIIGTSIFKYSANNDIEAMIDSFETWKKTGKVKNREIWLKTKDGTAFPTLISANNLYDENGSLIGSNTIIEDISEVYEARKKIERE